MLTEEAIKAAVVAALTEHKEAFWVEAEQHYQDHQAILKCRSQENLKDHEFIRGIREQKDVAYKIGWKMFVIGGLGFIGIAAWERVLKMLFMSISKTN